MREKPSGKELLEIAREVLREKVLPSLPDENRYDALMIANAIAIVMRQLEDKEDHQNEEQHALNDLVNGTGTVEELNAELSRQIRQGRVGGLEIWNFLRKISLAKVAESNPKYLR